MIKRGRPLGSKNKTGSRERHERRANFAICALRDILGARPFREGIKIIGMTDERAGFESPAFTWTQAYTAGILKRLDEDTV